MEYLETLAGQVVWVAKNMAYNLDFIPADKLDWKPAPTANSAIEVVNHAVTALKATKPILSGGSFAPPEFAHATNAEEAKQLLIESAEEYAQALKSVNPADLGKTVEMRFGKFTLARIASMPVIDVIHHHGQIAYIQTMLGDTESHFDTSLF